MFTRAVGVESAQNIVGVSMCSDVSGATFPRHSIYGKLVRGIAMVDETRGVGSPKWHGTTFLEWGGGMAFPNDALAGFFAITIRTVGKVA